MTQCQLVLTMFVAPRQDSVSPATGASGRKQVSSRTSSPVVSSPPLVPSPPPPVLPLALISPEGCLLLPADGSLRNCVSSYMGSGPVSSAAGVAAAARLMPSLLPTRGLPTLGSEAPSAKLRYSVSSRMQMGCVNADGRIEDLQAVWDVGTMLAANAEL